MVLLLRKRHLLTVVAAVALCGALLLTARPGAAAVSGSASPQRAVILDAGHGGADGGAVSDSGVAERKSVWRSSTDALTLGSSVSTRTACRVIPVSAVHRSSITDRTVQKRWRCAFRTI